MSREIKFRHIKPDGSIEFEQLNREMSGGYIEQYTGLKDKNGKEIYEGDIVKARDWDGDWRKYRIKWKQSHCAFEAFECGKYGEWNFSLTAFTSFEVIGNIHENKELLAKTTKFKKGKRK